MYFRPPIPILATLCFAFSIFGPLKAQVSNPLSAQPVNRITTAVNEQRTVALAGNHHPLAQAQNDAGLSDPNYAMERMILTLQSDSSQQAALDSLIEAQHDVKSSLYHQWLTPAGFAAKFGASFSDINQVTSWLSQHGLSVEEVSAGGRTILFSGTAAQVQAAFRTEIHQYTVNGEKHYANASDPQIPAALASVVRSVVSMHDFRRQTMHGEPQPVGAGALFSSPSFTGGTAHNVAPADFATIYNVNPLYASGTDGTGQTIAIVGRSNIRLSDIQLFRSHFGLPVNNPTIIVNGTNPGILSGNEETEADLDVEWSGAVAPKATVKFVVSASTSSTDGVDLSAYYIVNNNVAPVMSVSFGSCEAAMSAGEQAFWHDLWQQAAAQGITAFVSSGDSGAAGCNSSGASRGTRLGVNGLCSTPYNVCVGGTQFNDSNYSLYWAATNSSSTQGSALSYIPEVVWNESGSDLAGSGGGVSALYSKPSWQTGTGVPNDGHRDVPDVSLTAAGHDGYLIYQDGSLWAVGGTSASSPSFAGIMALVNEQTSGTQGNANTNFYRLATAQSSGGAAVFHDIVGGNNTVPGVTGFNAGPGYDLATGLGSVDVNQLVTNWGSSSNPVATLRLTAASASGVLVQGHSITVDTTVAVGGTFSSSVAMSVTGLPTGVTASFDHATLAAPGSGSPVLTLTASSTAAAGTYPLTISAVGGGQTKTATFSLTINPPASFSVAEDVATAQVNQGGSGHVNISVSNLVGGFNAAVALSTSTLPTGVTATFTPASIAAPGSGSSALAFAVGASVPAGTYPVTVTATGSGVTKTLNLSLKVIPPASFTLRAAPAAVTLAAGNSYTSGNIISTGLYGFSGSVALTTSTPPSGVTVHFGSSTIPGADGTTVMSIATTSAATPGTYSITVTGTSTGIAPSPTATVALTITPFTFSFTESTTALTMAQGTTSSAVSLAIAGPANGFSSAIALAATGLPSGVTAHFSTASIAAPASGSAAASVTFQAAGSAAAGTYPVSLTATANGVTKTLNFSLKVTPPATFTLKAAPAAVTLAAGNSNTYGSILATGLYGFTGNVALTTGTLPSGVSVHLGSSTIAGSDGSTGISIATTSAVTPGTYTITVTGASAGITPSPTTTVTLTVTPFTFSFTEAASSLTMAQSTASSAVSLAIAGPANGFSSAITLAATGLPSGVTAVFSTSSIAAPASGMAAASVTFHATGSAATGAYPVSLTATANGVTKSLSFSLRITPPATFSLRAVPPAVTLTAGNSYTSGGILATGLYGFTGNVALTTSTLPSGVTVHFASNTIAGSDGSTNLSIATTSAVTPGTYTITVTGTSTGISPSPTTTVTLTVAPFTFSFTEAANTVTMPQSTSSSAVNLAIAGPANGFTSPITLAATGLPSGVTATFSSASIAAPASGAAAASVTFHATGSAPAGTYAIALTATANGVAKTVSLSLRVTPPQTFTLRAAPSAVTLSAGNSYTSGSLISTGLYGFSGNVALATSTLPTGVTVHLGSNTIAGSDGSTSVSIATTSAVTPGSYTITITGTSTGVSPAPTVAITLTVTPFTFNFTESMNSVTMAQSTTSPAVSLAIVGPANGFSSAIALAATGLPSGVTATFSSSSIAAPASGSATASVTFQATGSAATGTFPVSLTATANGITKSLSFLLRVTPPATFSLRSSAPAINVAAGGTTTTLISSTAMYGFSGNVALAAGTTPSGVTVTFAHSTISGDSGSTTMTVATTNAATAGSYTIVVTGTASGVTPAPTVSITLNVGSVSLSTSASSVSVARAGSATLTLHSTATAGLTSPLTLSASGVPAGVTITFQPAQIAPVGGSSTLKISAASSVAVGSGTVTITGTDNNGATRTVTFTLAVQ